MKRIFSNHHGVTLVELMVVVGLFSVLGLAVATLYLEYTRFSVKNQNTITLTEDLRDMTFTLENYLTQTTAIINCACGGGCDYDAAAPSVTGENAGTLLSFQFENSTSPGGVTPSSQCLPLGAPNVPGMIGFLGNPYPSKGCRQEMRLVYQPPTPIVGNNVGNPGTLQIVVVIDAANNVTRVVHQMDGVTYFRCGMRVNTGTGVTQPYDLRYEIRAKARLSNRNQSPTPAELEGWHPNDATFGLGIHRNSIGAASFRNLTLPGMYFGKTTTQQNCTRDGMSSPQGTCCSGFRQNSGTFDCLAMGSCIPSGGLPGTGGPFPWTECCSHTTWDNGGTTTCL